MASKISGKSDDSGCYCGTGRAYALCCQPLVEKQGLPASAEQLMRSRYSAFVVEDEHYLLASWHPDTRPSRVSFDSDQRWLGLRIKHCEAGGSADVIGRVEFVARYKRHGKGYRLHEVSRFEKIDAQWYYLDGEHR